MKRHCSVEIAVDYSIRAKTLMDALNKVPDTALVTIIRGYTGSQFDSSPDKIKISWDEEL